MKRNGIDLIRARASFEAPGVVSLRQPDGSDRTLQAPRVVIATGSRPRCHPQIPVDHEHILDSDSLLSLGWLPRSLVVLGSGVVASEYASVFQRLGVSVTMVDRFECPVGFVDPELCGGFLKAFRAAGGTFLSGRRVVRARFDGVSACITQLDDGTVLESDKVVCAMGRQANVESLGLDALGVSLSRSGHIPVSSDFLTTAPGTAAVGDVIGFPAMASTSMEQGRRAVLHMCEEDVPEDFSVVPMGIYTVPEMSTVGLTEAKALTQHGAVRVGRSSYAEVSRAHIQGDAEGLLKLIATEEGRLLGVHVLGEGAASLVHLGQVGLMSGWTLDRLVETTWNYPTMAECYRVAALDALQSEVVVGQARAVA